MNMHTPALVGAVHDVWPGADIATNVVSVSGGKDSTALYLLALERGRPFRAVFADTGNEHEWTYEFVRTLAQKTGGPEVEWVVADLTHHIARKRRYVAEKWPGKGVPQDIIDRTLAVLHPSGNPFLDLVLWKTRFPSSKARFCTEELKVQPIIDRIYRPLWSQGMTVVSWQGVRADESLTRRDLPMWQRVFARGEQHDGELYAFRPLIDWTVKDVFAFHRRHGIEPNPLYRCGMGRVGCMPCIMATKDEIRSIAEQFPAHVDRIAEWEEIASQVSKRGITTFFSTTDDPMIDDESVNDVRAHGIRAKVQWSRTTHGGKQYDLMLARAQDATSCDQWGACE